VLALDQSLTANESRMSIETRYFDAVITKVDVVHLIPIEVRHEKQFSLSWLNELYRIVPITPRCLRSRFLNHDWYSMHNRGNYVEKGNGNLEKVS
jgi:hypothetical protein